MQSENSDQHSRSSIFDLARLVHGSLGVVYGDIGTSVLYAVNEIFFHQGTIKTVPTPDNVYGAISLIFWTLTLVITVKYSLVLRADNKGEGGVFALLGLLNRSGWRIAVYLGPVLIFAAALLYGDGIITPVISTYAAWEGLKIVNETVFTQNNIVIIVLITLTLLFLIQSYGTGNIGKMFGWIIILWFAAIGTMGSIQIRRNPEILFAISPHYALMFIWNSGIHHTFSVLGSVMLVATGGEAMFADMGHFGRRPILIGWRFVAYPALLLNYFGQGAYLLSGDVIFNQNIFYSLVPASLLIPMVILSTMATIIASQALISGVYSLTAQAISMRLFPRFLMTHTNKHHIGQIYMPGINWMLFAGCIWLALTFRSSSELAAAYGLAVAAVMLATSLAMIPLSIILLKWSRKKALVIFGLFSVIDLIFLSANSLKFVTGGYVPILIGVLLSVLMFNWRWGRNRIANAYAQYRQSKTMQWFITLKQRLQEHNGYLHDDNGRHLRESERIGIFLTSQHIMSPQDGVPVVMRAYLKRLGTLPKHIIFLTIEENQTAHVDSKERYHIVNLGADIWSINVTFGFMQFMDTKKKPNIQTILIDLNHMHDQNGERLFPKDLYHASIEAGEEEFIIPHHTPVLIKIWAKLFRFQLKCTTSALRYFGLTGDTMLSRRLGKTVVSVILDQDGNANVRLPDSDRRPNT